MNPGSADQALDSVINVDVEWMQHFYAGMTKPPDASRSSSAMNDELEMEMELINIINTAKKRSCMIAAPAINTGRMGSCYLAAGMKPELDMRRIAASLISSAEATSVTTRAVSGTSCGMIISDVSGAANTSSGFNKYSSALPRGPPQPAVTAAAASSGGLCRGSGVVKVKKKRVRPSRRVPTTVVKTDASNFKAMVEQFTGIPPTFTQESTAAPSASSSVPQSSNSASSPSFSKPLPHPVLCKISNSSSMVEHFTGTPTTTTTTTTQESTTSPSASSSSPQSTRPASPASFRKPLPHPAVCKISNYSAAPNPDTSAATATCPSPLLPSSFPTCQSLPDLPFISNVSSTTVSGYIPNSADPEELTMASLIDAAFFDELWN